jgi:hypothetical protein
MKNFPRELRTLLSMLAHDQLEDELRWINSVLHNDEVSSDEEIVQHFISEGVSEQRARAAVAQRQECLVDMFHVVRV